MRTAIIYNFLLEANLMACMAILLMLPIRQYLRKQLGSRVISFGWLLIAIRLLCPLALPNPAINAIRSPFAADEAIRPIAGQLQVRFSDAVFEVYQWVRTNIGRESGVAERMGQLVDSTSNGMLSIHLMHLYVLGVLAVVGWFVISNFRFRRRMKADRLEPLSGDLLEQYEALCEERRVKPLPVWYVDPLPSACLVGVFRPYIALPLTAAPQEALHVLRHEVCHYRAGDHWWGLVRLGCCALHWFNPLVWLAAHMSRTDLELACDDRVKKGLDDEQKKAYAGMLVLAAAQRDLPGVAVLSTGMSMTGRKLKARVSAILHEGRISRGLALAFVLLASMALVGAFATAEYFPRPSVPEISTRLEMKEIGPKNEEELIAYAKEIWQHEVLREDPEDYRWSAYRMDGHFEVLAKDAQDNLHLACAFRSNGQIIYLCNFVSGDRDAFVTDTPLYLKDEAYVEKLRRFAADAVSALVPPLHQTIQRIALGDESALGDDHFLSFFETGVNGDIIRGVRVQVGAEPRLTYFIDETYFTFNDADRLEPGNG